jgi:hypothetical protein
MNFLLEKKYGVPSNNFVKKNVLCEKGDEITRFDGNKQTLFRAAIQRRGSILAWIVILSVYDADTFTIDLSLSALIS